MKPATPCPDPVPDITICVGEPARGLDPGSVETGTAKAEGAKRTTIAEAVIIEKAIRVRKRGTKRHTNRKPGQWPCLIGIWSTVRSLHIRKRRRPLHLFGQISDAVPSDVHSAVARRSDALTPCAEITGHGFAFRSTVQTAGRSSPEAAAPRFTLPSDFCSTVS